MVRAYLILLLIVPAIAAAPLPARRVLSTDFRITPRAGDADADLERFPSPEMVAAALEWCDAHERWLRVQRSLDLVHPQFWDAWIADARAAVLPWRTLRRWQNGCAVAWDDGASSLSQLLCDQIGADAFAAGLMPVHTPPLWRFRRID